MQHTQTIDRSINSQELLASFVAAFSAQWPRLDDKPEESPVSGIRALWFAAAGENCSLQKASETELPRLDSEGKDRLSRLIERRLTGVPLAYLVGWQRFMGLEFKSGPQSFIPRKETEILAHAALERLQQIVTSRGPAKIIDVCTGSGNLATTLASRQPACRVFAVDLLADAVALAKENAALHKLQDRIEFRMGDLFAPFAQDNLEGSVDMIICNPPYMSSSKARALPRELAEFEPRAAFDAGSVGLAVISRLISEAPQYLKPDSWLCFEIGAGQGPFLISRLKQSGAYRRVETEKDEAGEVRALLAGT
jgi:release factor glutamine methyltransferase